MKKYLAILGVLGLLLLTVATTIAASPQAGQCDGYNDPANTKVDTSNNDLVLPAGLTICIHASNGNTGSLVTDGTSTLHDYIVASGLLNDGGQVPDVSNYVTYGTGTPSSPPSNPPSNPPSSNPSEPPEIAAFAVTPAPCRTVDEDSRLAFRVIKGALLINQVDIFIDGQKISAADIEIVNGEAFVVVAPGERAWEIRDQDTGAVLASGTAICPTCRDVFEGSPSASVPPTTTKTAPPTDTDSGAASTSGDAIGIILIALTVAGLSAYLVGTRKRA